MAVVLLSATLTAIENVPEPLLVPEAISVAQELSLYRFTVTLGLVVPVIRGLLSLAGESGFDAIRTGMAIPIEFST